MPKHPDTNEPAAAQSRIFCVIVLYKTTIGNAEAFATFRHAFDDLDPAEKYPAALLFDNTPSVVIPESVPPGFFFESAGTNAGLASAYNRALALAQERGSSWLLLLDQDTRLPTDFLRLLSAEIEKYEADEHIAAIAPIVQDGREIISPKRVAPWGLRPLPPDTFGVQNEEITCINSGTAVRCSFIRSLGGFNRFYWLDFLDYWLFRQIYAAGKKVAVFNRRVTHDLSVRDYARNVSNERYRNILRGESAFMTTYRPKSQIPLYLLRLLLRSVRLATQRRLHMALFTLSVIVRISLHPTRSLENGSR